MTATEPSPLFGVKAFIGESYLSELKRAALLFDRLMTVELPMNHDTLTCMVHGLVDGKDAFVVGWPVEKDHQLDIRPPMLREGSLEAMTPDGETRSDELSRGVAAMFSATDMVSAVALVSSPDVQGGTRTNVLHAVLNELPLPTTETPWEDIFAWRHDADARRKYARLRHWINQLARSDVSRIEVKDAVAAALADYQTYMSLHYRSMQRSRSEVVLLTTAEVLEDLVSFKWSRAIGRLFALHRSEASILAEELKAPGREIAYISAARERFK